jgi:hypothetical protein
MRALRLIGFRKSQLPNMFRRLISFHEKQLLNTTRQLKKMIEKRTRVLNKTYSFDLLTIAL